MLDLRDLNSDYTRAMCQHKRTLDSAFDNHDNQAHRYRQGRERIRYNGIDLHLQSASSGRVSRGKKPVWTDRDDIMRRKEPRCAIPFIQCS
jgi:hypothetical protein